MGNKRSHHGRGTALAESPGADGFQIKGRLWLEREGETYLSWGRVVLLERIREHHSIAAGGPFSGHGLQPRLVPGGRHESPGRA